MSNLIYPVAHPSGGANMTPEQVHALLGNPRAVAKRVADLTKMRFIADFLLQGRFNAVGGGIFYETGEEIFAADSPEAIAAGGEYPSTVMTEGELSSAKTVKWGIESAVTDEKIAQLGIVPVNKTLRRLSNTVVRHVDRVAMAVITAKVTSSFGSVTQWTTAGQAVRALTTIQTQRGDEGTGLELDTVVLRAEQHAEILGMLMDDKALPREKGEIALEGKLPVDVLGFVWATTPHYTGDVPLLVDRDNLGGMADQDLKSPGYAKAGEGVGVETKVIRDDDRDQWKPRARRVTVPVVLDERAGVRLLNTGLEGAAA